MAEELELGTRTGKAGATLLEVDHFIMRYATKEGDVSALEDVSFSIKSGEALGLVGESGCGKTTMALSLLRLLPDNGNIISGEIRLDGESLTALSEEEMRKHRWRDISMVFQGAMNAWNPVYTVGDQIREALRLHWPTSMTYSEETERILDSSPLSGWIQQ